MEYYNNPIKTYTNTVLPYDRDCDPIVHSSHGGEHCLFFQPMLPKAVLKYQQKLTDLADWANNHPNLLDLCDSLEYTVEELRKYTDDPENFHDMGMHNMNLRYIASLVKVNLWVNDIRNQGIVKPLLLAYTGEDEPYIVHNGETRLRCLEVIPEITTVDCFITTHRRHADRFSALPEIENFAQYTEICQAEIGQQFQFRFTDPDAPYGIDWYETNSRKTGKVMQIQDECILLIRNYLRAHPLTVFSTDWFSTPVDWNLYKTY